MHCVQMKPGAQRFTTLDLRSRYWGLIRLNLVRRSVKFQSPWRPQRAFWNTRGIHLSRPYVASLMLPLWWGRGVANFEVKLIQTLPEALSWQVVPRLAVRAVRCAVNGVGYCWWSTGSPAVWRRVSFALGQVVAGYQWSSEVRSVIIMGALWTTDRRWNVLSQQVTFFILLKGWAWWVKLMLIVLDVVVHDWDLPVIMTNPLSIFTSSNPDSPSLIW